MEPLDILLDQSGLSQERLQVYLALLSHGPLTLAEISRLTRQHRPALYRLMPSLVARGLVKEGKKGKRRVYAAADPAVLKGLAHEHAQRVAEVIPELERLAAKGRVRPEVNFRVGLPATREALEEFMSRLKRGDVYYRLSSRKTGTDWKRYLTPRYLKLDDEKKPEHFVITNTPAAMGYRKKLERAVKVLPDARTPFEHDVNLIIYQDTVLFVDYSSDTSLEIRSKVFVEYFQHVFKALYDRL